MYCDLWVNMNANDSISFPQIEKNIDYFQYTVF